jgi:hypothetical protein
MHIRTVWVLTVTEDPVIRSNIHGGSYPSVEVNAYLQLEPETCLGIDGRVPVFERGVVWDPASQTLIHPSGAVSTVGAKVHSWLSVLPIDGDLHQVISRRAYQAVRACSARHGADEILLVYSPPGQ